MYAPFAPGLPPASSPGQHPATAPVLSSRPPTLTWKPPSVQSPFAQPRCYLDWGDVFPSPPWALPHGHRSYGLMRPSPCLSCSSVYSLVSGVSAGCHSAPAANGMFPMLSPQIFLQMPGSQPRRSHRVHLPVPSPMSSAFPRPFLGRLPACSTNAIFRGEFSSLADIPLCSSL